MFGNLSQWQHETTHNPLRWLNPPKYPTNSVACVPFHSHNRQEKPMTFLVATKPSYHRPEPAACQRLSWQNCYECSATVIHICCLWSSKEGDLQCLPSYRDVWCCDDGRWVMKNVEKLVDETAISGLALQRMPKSRWQCKHPSEPSQCSSGKMHRLCCVAALMYPKSKRLPG